MTEHHPADGISVVIPTYREAPNLTTLVTRLNGALAPMELSFEILIVDDDSRDQSIEIVTKLSKQFPVAILVRTDERDLSTAVLHGFHHAKFNTLLVMDADLSHAPEDVPKVLAPILSSEADFSLGSRHVQGGTIEEDWGLLRRLCSWSASRLTLPLVQVHDPMSGFFALRRSVLENADHLNPLGYKIALELLVKSRTSRIIEIPIRFGLRAAGKSKLNARQSLRFFLHLTRLYAYRRKTRHRRL